MNHERNGHSPGADGRIAAAAGGRLAFTDAQGQTHVGLEPMRAFPFSAPRRGIALCDADGRELHWIEDLDALPAER